MVATIVLLFWDDADIVAEYFTYRNQTNEKELPVNCYYGRCCECFCIEIDQMIRVATFSNDGNNSIFVMRP